MPSTEERVIEIVCENLGVNKEQVTRQTSLVWGAVGLGVLAAPLLCQKQRGSEGAICGRIEKPQMEGLEPFAASWA